MAGRKIVGDGGNVEVGWHLDRQRISLLVGLVTAAKAEPRAEIHLHPHQVAQLIEQLSEGLRYVLTGGEGS